MDTHDVIAERWHLCEVLGSGSFGIVWRARCADSTLTRAVKISTTKLTAAAHLLREAEFLAKVNHSNILRVYEYGMLRDGRSFMIMDLIEGASLESIYEHRHIALKDVIIVGECVASALVAIHSLGVLHRDIKPRNIMVPVVDEVPDFGRATLVDFGVHEPLTAQDHTRAGSTQPGKRSGTALYMPPEQATGRPQGAATDLYAVGATMYSLLFHRLPASPADATVLEFHLGSGDGAPKKVTLLLSRLIEDAVLPATPELPPVFAEFLLKLLDRIPSNRPQTAQEVLAHLRRIRALVESSSDPMRAGDRTANEGALS